MRFILSRKLVSLLSTQCVSWKTGVLQIKVCYPPIRNSHLSIFCLVFKFRFKTKLKENWRDFPHIPCLHTCITPTLSTSLTKMLFFFPNNNLHWHHNHLKSIVYLTVYSWCLTCYGFELCLITYVSHYNIIQKYLPLPWNSSVFCLFISPSSLPHNYWSFYGLHRLPFSRMPYAEIMYVAFSDWLLSFTNIHVIFSVFLWFDSSFFYITE